jgi:hypothetical protein
MMGLLYTFPRRLFWRRWQPKSSKSSQHFFPDLVWELSNSMFLYFSNYFHVYIMYLTEKVSPVNK